jgi:hypothetical protein
MSNENRSSDDVPPAKEPAATPLFSVEQLDIGDYPLIHVPEERVYAFGEFARRLSEDWQGTVRDHLNGKLGEFSVASPLGIDDRIDTEIYADGGDDGVDLQYRGATIDVKTVGRDRDDPALTVDAYEPLRADYYALASRVSKTDVRLVGYAPREFVANAPVWYHEGEPYHLVEQRYLFPFPRSLF